MTAATSFEDLNDDCILLVIQAAAVRSPYSSPSVIKNLSLVSKRLRFLCHTTLFRPSTLFLPWPKPASPVVDSFKALVVASTVAPTIQALSVDLSDSFITGHYGVTLCGHLASALAALPNLSQLHLDLVNDEDLCLKLRTAFNSLQLELPVKVLKLSRAPNAAFVLQSCPSLNTFIAASLDKKWKRTFTPLLASTTIRRLEINTSQNWTARRLQELKPYIRNLTELYIKKELYKVKLSDLAASFVDFDKLAVLSVTCVQWFNQMSWASFDYDEDEDGQQSDHPLYEPPITVAKTFLDDCKQLESFRLLSRSSGTKYWRGSNGNPEHADTSEDDDVESFGFATAFPVEGAWED